MNPFIIILVFFLILVILAACYLFFALRSTNKNLIEISEKLKEIMDHDSDERIKQLTDNKELIKLMEQINGLLDYHGDARAEYRRTERAYKKMLSNISHDIKTPMTVVLGYLEIMRLQGADSDMLQKTENKAADVVELIDQFFNLAKLEAGDMNVDLSKMDICEICRASVLEFYEMLTQGGFQVDVKLPEKPVYVQGNQEAIQRILFNLITNVIRYGSEGNYFGMHLLEYDTTVHVDIIDKGKGIDENFADRIFDRLFTMEDSRNRQVQGNGLGLTIARNLAEQLDGALTLESTPYARTVFTLQLPKSTY